MPKQEYRRSWSEKKENEQTRIRRIKSGLILVSDDVLELYLAAEVYMAKHPHESEDYGDKSDIIVSRQRLTNALKKVCPAEKVITDLTIERQQVFNTLSNAEIDAETVDRIMDYMDKEIDECGKGIVKNRNKKK